jgi:hypothetical protein
MHEGPANELWMYVRSSGVENDEEEEEEEEEEEGDIAAAAAAAVAAPVAAAVAAAVAAPVAEAAFVTDESDGESETGTRSSNVVVSGPINGKTVERS